MKILGAVFELPAKQRCQSSPFTSKLGQIGQIGNAVLLLAPKRLPGFDFFNCPVCRLFFSYEIRCYFYPHIFWIYHFSLCHCERSHVYLCFVGYCIKIGWLSIFLFKRTLLTVDSARLDWVYVLARVPPEESRFWWETTQNNLLFPVTVLPTAT